MGLDMYLHYKNKMGYDDEAELAIYWRKSNAVHGWFERHISYGGIENCELYDVTVDDLEQLRDDCKEVLYDHSKAPEILPSQEGFFFGQTDYNRYYFEDLMDTIIDIEKLLDSCESDEQFVYHAWW